MIATDRIAYLRELADSLEEGSAAPADLASAAAIVRDYCRIISAGGTVNSGDPLRGLSRLLAGQERLRN